MAIKLRSVAKGESTQAPKELRAKQVFTFQLVDGGDGFGMVSLEGIVYMFGANGRVACNMREDISDNTTV